MSVSQAVFDAAPPNGFKWRSLNTGEFGTSQHFLELVQQYVGQGLGCVSPAEYPGDGGGGGGGGGGGNGNVRGAQAAAAKPCEKVLFISHVFYFELQDFLVPGKSNFQRPACVSSLHWLGVTSLPQK